MTTPITCLIADDHPAVLLALAGYLESAGNFRGSRSRLPPSSTPG
jgi:hypothetical protein